MPHDISMPDVTIFSTIYIYSYFRIICINLLNEGCMLIRLLILLIEISI